MNGPVLFTERLILRPPAAEDFEPWAAFHADEATMRYLGGVQPRSVAWRGLCAMAGSWQLFGFAMFSVIERTSGRWLGRIGPWRPDGWPGNEIAWGLLPEFAGKGFAQEAAVAATDYAVDVLRWDDVMHRIAPLNAPSIALARRLGATNRGPTVLPPPHGLNAVDDWGQTAAEWRARRAALR